MVRSKGTKRIAVINGDKTMVKRILLLVFTAMCLLLAGLIAFAVCAMIAEIYEESSGLNYKNLTIILIALNAIPAMIAMMSVIRFAFTFHGEVMTAAKKRGLFRILRRAFYIQAGYSFMSVAFLGQLLDVGPAFVMLITLFVVFVSLMLALLFDVLDTDENLISSETDSADNRRDRYIYAHTKEDIKAIENLAWGSMAKNDILPMSNKNRAEWKSD